MRIGELGGLGIEEEERKRRSKDKVIGNSGRNFVNWLMEKGWNILNGRTEGDWEGEYTYMEGESTYVEVRGSTVINYIVVSEELGDKVIEFKIGERVESDHMPLSVKIEEKEGRGEEEEEHGTEEQDEEVEVIQWNEEAVRKYVEATEEIIKQEEGQEASQLKRNGRKLNELYKAPW